MSNTDSALYQAPEPDYAVAPGETLRERLEELGMTQAELARRTGMSIRS
jgi:HTH-type transcriptional regulator/antitoxin HigA